MAAEVNRQHPWRSSGVWLMGDTHTHHRLIGGAEMLAGADPRCDFVALTSHAHNPDAVSAHPEIILAATKAHPDLILVNGVEWNTPTYELAAVLVSGGAGAMPVVDELIDRYDRQVAGLERSDELFLKGLRFLAGQGEDDLRPGVILQHVHSPDDFAVVRSKAALESGSVIGVSAASRRHVMDDGTLISPWASEVGGVLDRLYAEGARLTMVAESDFHHHRDLDEHMVREWPGEFMRNFVYCPEKTEAGLFAGLRGGCSYFVIGNIIEDLVWSVSSGGESAIPGEELSVAPGAEVEVAVTFRENVALDRLELIGNTGGHAAVVASSDGGELPRAGGIVTWKADLRPSGGLSFVRLRGSPADEVDDVKGLQFYANPVWIRTQHSPTPK